jgi:hypothetical protein
MSSNIVCDGCYISVDGHEVNAPLLFIVRQKDVDIYYCQKCGKMHAQKVTD